MQLGRARIIRRGVWIGIINALSGSMWFTFLAILMLGVPINHQTMSGLIFQGFIPGVFISLMFSVLPGAIGGAFLGLILTNEAYSLRRSWIIGQVIGAFAGLILDFVGILLLGTDDLIIGLAIIAFIIASIMGGLGSRSLVRKFNRVR